MTDTSIVGFQSGGKRLTLSFSSPEDHIAEVIRQTGTFYEAEMLADARSRLFYPECAVDVGAHVGNHSIYFSHVLGLRTLAFEPSADTFARLEENIAANGLSDRCVARRAAVGANAGRGHAVVAEAANSGMSRVESDPGGEVEIVTLDDALDEPRIDLIKIDVEGWELDVLHGATLTLERHRPLLYIEAMQSQFGAVRTHLSGAGYVCWKRFNATPTFLFMPRERLGAA